MLALRRGVTCLADFFTVRVPNFSTMAARQLDAELARTLMNSVDNIIFDCDGVLWDGRGAVPGSVDTVNLLRSMGKRIFYITNNSSRTRKEYAEKCSMYGYPAGEEDIMCTAFACAQYLQSVSFQGKVFLVGNPAIEAELRNIGITCIGVGPDPSVGKLEEWIKMELDPQVKCVLVGFDQDLSYLKIMKAASYAQQDGCLFIGTNVDTNLPVPDCNIVIPGTGTMVMAVSVPAKRQPLIIGKPESTMFDLMAKTHNLDPSRTLMVGDNLITDMAFAKNCSMHSMFVLTGVHKLKHIPQNGVSPLPGPHRPVLPEFYTSCLGDLSKYLNSKETR